MFKFSQVAAPGLSPQAQPQFLLLPLAREEEVGVDRVEQLALADKVVLVEVVVQKHSVFIRQLTSGRPRR